MAFIYWFRRPAWRRGHSRRTDDVFRPRLEPLERRELPSGNPPLRVHPGDPGAYQTIQSAVDAAHPGDVVVIDAGTYPEAVTVSTPGLTLRAARGAAVTIENPGGAANGVTVEGPSGTPLVGFKLLDVTVRGFDADGVFLSGVTGFVLAGVHAVDNGEYGLFPVLSSDGVIRHSSASGSNDTGIYVGQSSNVAVVGCQARDNVNGIEIENSVHVAAVGNRVFQNTMGILADLLPGFPDAYEVSSHNLIAGNLVYDNNRPNTASPDDIASVEPLGVGIAVVGGDHTLVRGNVVTGNAYAGIAVLSGNDVLALAQAAGIVTPPYPPGVDPDPDFTTVRNNIVLGNGFIDPTSVPAGFPAPADLVWTGSGSYDHWKDNFFVSSSPGELP